MSETTKAKFFTVNIGHLITIFINVVTLAYFLGVNYQILKQHTSDLAAHTTKIEKIEDSSNKNFNIVTSEGYQISALDLRVTRIENSISKLELVENDLSWIKKYLTDKSSVKN